MNWVKENELMARIALLERRQELLLRALKGEFRSENPMHEQPDFMKLWNKKST